MNTELKKEIRMQIILKRVCDIQPDITKACNEIGFSELYADLYRSELIYNTTSQNWLYYDGIRWCDDSGGTQAALKAREMQEALYYYATRFISDPEARDTYIKMVAKYGALNKRESLVRDARALMAKSYKDFDNKTYLFNCLNNTIDLRSFEVYGHDSDDMLSKVAGCEYIPDAKSEIWEKFVFDIMLGDKEKIRYLRKAAGCSLYPEIILKIIFILLGFTTNNGKTTFMEAIGGMMGDYGLSVEPQTLAQAKFNNGGVARPDIARLDGVRFANISEPPKRMLLDVALVKKLTGNDMITTRRLYQDSFDFKPQFKMFMHCNNLPVVTDDTLFSSDRVRIIEFNRHFAEHEQDKELLHKLQRPEVKSSILNWALDGLRDYLENGERPPKCVITATAEYEKQSDKIIRFFDDCMEKSDTNTTGNDAHKAFCIWCSDNGYAAEKKSTFFQTLRERGLLSATATIKGKGTVKNVIVGYGLCEDMQNVQNET